MRRWGYGASVQEFLFAPENAVLGALTAASSFDPTISQINAWQASIANLREQLVGFSGHVFFEFTIPRLGSRADVVLLKDGIIFILEYKVGSDQFLTADLDQAHGYALDLKNFHERSHDRLIVPILVSTEAKNLPVKVQFASDGVADPIRSNGSNIHSIISEALTNGHGPTLEAVKWAEGRYKPTPTIIEAAQALYRNHSVDEITRNEAGAENLSATAGYVNKVIESAKSSNRKAICFITGVPGSGKTLAGLNIANLRTKAAEDEHAVFLSGNGPLVKVLRAALERDARSYQSKNNTTRSITQFVQNIHHFRDDNLDKNTPPIEKVVIFDEAQRAWNHEQTEKFMKKRSGLDFSMSEPEYLISVMDRHPDWCVVICLVGNGQEINTGEAGIAEWLRAITRDYDNWDVHVSEYMHARFDALNISAEPNRFKTEPSLHLATSIRSFRSERLADYIDLVLDGRPNEAADLCRHLDKFEIVLTRNINSAREWIRRKRRATERSGLVAFSSAIRLKAEGVFVKNEIEPENWFLNSRDDIRSSDYLEDCVTEFDVQGLELDWTCVCVDANIRIDGSILTPMLFRGTKWQQVRDEDRKKYILNAHRVLLTRARQGMVIFIPPGSSEDHTRDPRWYEDIYQYLKSCGVPDL